MTASHIRPDNINEAAGIHTSQDPIKGNTEKNAITVPHTIGAGSPSFSINEFAF